MTRKTLILLCLLSFTAVIVYSKAKGPHEFSDNECSICHVGSSSAPSSRQKQFSVTKMCLICHTTLFEEGYMHPVDIKPKKVTIPLDFPLSKSGTLTCNTCHDIHAPDETPFGKPSHFLRRYETGKAFCDICHINSLAVPTGHQTVFRQAHYKSKYTETDPVQTIDSLSKNCLSCHDGSFASSVDVKAGKWQHSKNFLKFDKGGMHPIGMNYEKSRMSNVQARLRPIHEVDKRIRFFGNKNKMGCGSCHNPFSTKNNKLVFSNKQSRLCFGCHNL